MSVRNQPFDEAFDVTVSTDAENGNGDEESDNLSLGTSRSAETLDETQSMNHDENDVSGKEHNMPARSIREGVLNKPFDAAFDVDNDGDESSLETEPSDTSQGNSIESRPASSESLPRGDGLSSSSTKITSLADTKRFSPENLNKHGQEEFDYDQLPVSDEIKKLFELVDVYEPIELEIDTPLKCFIPPYIPAIGEVDPFLKVPRPDGVPDGIGLTVLDEPNPSSQSNAAVVELQLRNRSKKKRSGHPTVRSIDNASKNTREIDQWIQSVEEIHATKAAPEVRYQNKMPRFEELLMQPMPREMEEALKCGTLGLPTADIDLSIEEYVRVICCLLGIPVYNGNLVESVHVLLSMYIQLNENILEEQMS